MKARKILKYFIISPFLWTATSAYASDKIDGFGGYNFGMPLAEALRIRADAKQTKCEYKNVDICIEYTEMIYGEQAKIAVIFNINSNKVDKIIVSFEKINSKKGSNECINVSRTMFSKLEKKYGEDFIMKNSKANFPEATWHPVSGGKVNMKRFCIDNDSGMVIIAYEQTGSL